MSYKVEQIQYVDILNPIYKHSIYFKIIFFKKQKNFKAKMSNSICIKL